MVCWGVKQIQWSYFSLVDMLGTLKIKCCKLEENFVHSFALGKNLLLNDFNLFGQVLLFKTQNNYLLCEA